MRFFMFFIVLLCALLVRNAYAEMEFFLRGNFVASKYFGRIDFTSLSVRNLELSMAGGRGLFYVKGSIDIEPIRLNLITQGIHTSQSPITTLSEFSGIREGLRLKEVFISTRGLPMLRFRAGRIYADIVGSNAETFWERGFIERKYIIREFFGQHGFIDQGIEASIFPSLPWNLEIVGQILDGNSQSFRSRGSLDLVYLIRVKNVIGGEEINGGLGGFFAVGKNGTVCDIRGDGFSCPNLTDMFGGDAFFRYSPYLFTRVEYVLRRMQDAGSLRVDGGISLEAIVRPARVVAFGLRPEFFGIPGFTLFDDGSVETRPQIFDLTLNTTFFPEDFIKIRLEWNGNFGGGRKGFNIISLQGIFDLR